jgi:hypothetical protein
MGLIEPISDGINASPIAQKLTSPLGVADGGENGGSNLLTRTQHFRDRVKGENGVIEDGSLENLYDRMFRTVKGFSGVGLSDLKFFMADSALENNSGSIPKIFDASGGEHDAVQNDTAKQAVLDKNSIGGRWGAYYGGSDDSMSVPTNPLTLTSPFTIVSLWTTNYLDTNNILWEFKNSSDDNYLGVGHRDNSVKLYSYGETPGKGSTISEDTAYIVSIEWDGTDFYVYLDGTLDYTVTPSSTNWQTATDEVNIGLSKTNSWNWVGLIISMLAIETTGVRGEIETRLSEYYSL